ncbi:MAG: 50S ribosomal protein L9, partial [Actinomycetota bacterium]
MKVILRADINGLGKRGDIVDVSDGHGRNYLLPRGLGIKASDGALAQAAAMRRRRDLRDAADREAAQTVASGLVSKVVDIKAKAGGEGRLFGSVTAADVVKAVESQAGVVLDRR